MTNSRVEHHGDLKVEYSDAKTYQPAIIPVGYRSATEFVFIKSEPVEFMECSFTLEIDLGENNEI